jgi:hypothetical protein
MLDDESSSSASHPLPSRFPSKCLSRQVPSGRHEAQGFEYETIDERSIKPPLTRIRRIRRRASLSLLLAPSIRFDLMMGGEDPRFSIGGCDRRRNITPPFCASWLDLPFYGP